MSIRWNPAFLAYAKANRDPERVAASEAVRLKRATKERARPGRVMSDERQAALSIPGPGGERADA